MDKARRLGVWLLAALLVAGMSMTVWAGQWQEDEAGARYYAEDGVIVSGWQEIDGDWYYFDADGVMQTGWVRTADNGKWYYLDAETGVWISKPQRSQETVCHLLENWHIDNHYYQTETEEVLYFVTHEDNKEYQIQVCYEDLPEHYVVLNRYTVRKSTGKTTDENAGHNFVMGFAK
ncbi:MAG: hypothetical protein LUC99_00420 [Clostridiales bacterium]|nr:hypothetical protein [Clostridiales bacterium]